MPPGVLCLAALCQIGKAHFEKPYSRKAVPSRNPIPGELYLPETLFRKGCTVPKPYSGKVLPSRNPILERLHFAESLDSGKVALCRNPDLEQTIPDATIVE